MHPAIKQRLAEIEARAEEASGVVDWDLTERVLEQDVPWLHELARLQGEVVGAALELDAVGEPGKWDETKARKAATKIGFGLAALDAFCAKEE